MTNLEILVESAARDRGPIMKTSVAVCGAAAVLLFAPLQMFWQGVYEGQRLFYWWPALFAVLTLILGVILTQREWQQRGRPMFQPVFAAGAIVIITSLMILLSIRTGPKVSSILILLWTLLAFPAIALACSLAKLAFGESWRLFANQAVVDRVKADLVDPASEGRRRNDAPLSVRVPLFKKVASWRAEGSWASPHCFTILRKNYDMKRAKLWQQAAVDRSEVNNVGGNRRLVLDFLIGAAALETYLQLKWPDDPPPVKGVPSEQERLALRASLLRELCTVAIWATNRGWLDPSGPEQQDIEGWLQQLPEAMKATDIQRGEVFGRALQSLLAVGHRPPPRSGDELCAIIARILNGILPLNGDEADIYCHSWLAVAPKIDDQALLDVWWNMREHASASDHRNWGLTLPPTNKPIDVALVCACDVLNPLLCKWEKRLHVGWHEGISLLQKHAKAVTDRLREQIKSEQQAAVIDRTQESAGIPSWLYSAVVEAPAVRRQVFVVAVVVWLCCASAAWISNPDLNLGFKNTIAHVDDPRPWASSPEGGYTCMALSGGWSALGTAHSGLTITNDASWVGRDHLGDGGTIDVAPGIESGSFLAASTNGSILELTPHDGFGVGQKDWLERPTKSLVWPGATAGGEILCNDLGPDGWNIVKAGAGIARYVLSRQNGASTRGRGFLLSDLSKFDVQQAFPTDTGYWLTDTNGEIRFASRADLKSVAGRAISIANLAGFDAGYSTPWAFASNAAGQLWTYRTTGGWQGPFFGNSDSQHLGGLQDVTSARLSAGTVWLGTGYGLFSYDIAGRRITCDISGERVAGLEHAGRTTVVGTNAGLHIFPSSTDKPMVDEGKVSDLTLSATGGLSAYMLGGTKARVLPIATGNPFSLFPDKGWRSLEHTPSITELHRTPTGLFFATTAGAFAYELDSHTYTDVSKTSIPPLRKPKRAASTQALRSVDHIGEGSGPLTIVSGSTVYVMNQPGQNDATSFTSVDPREEVQAVDAVTTSNRETLALDHQGWLHWFGSRANDYFSGSFPAKLDALVLASGYGSTQEFMGDGQGDKKGGYVAALMSKGQPIIYRSNDGSLTPRSLPDGIAANQIAQMRIDGDILLYVQKDGRVTDSNGGRLFGGPGLPFRPNLCSAIAPGDGSDMLIGGPNGAVTAYTPAHGQWKNLGTSGHAPVDELFSVPYGIIAHLVDKTVAVQKQDGWQRIPRCSRFAMDSNHQNGYLLFDYGIGRIDMGRSTQTGNTFSSGGAPRPTIANTRYVWAASPGVTAIFGNTPKVAVYHSDTDTWKAKTLQGRLGEVIGATRQFAIGPGFLACVAGSSVYAVKPDMQTNVLLPERADRQSLNLTGDGHRIIVTCVEGGHPIVRTWTSLHSSPVECSRGKGHLNGNFDIMQAVMAWSDGTHVFLADRSGSCVTYTPTTGNWNVVRQHRAGETAVSWVDGVRSALVIQVADGTTILSVVQNGALNDVAFAEAPQKTLARDVWKGAHVLTPVSGELLRTNSFLVTRANGRTHYATVANGIALPLTVTAQGFVEDGAQLIAVSQAGRIWSCVHGNLFELAVSPDGSRLQIVGHASGPSGVTGLTTLQNGWLRVVSSIGVQCFVDSGAHLVAAGGASVQYLAHMQVNARELHWQYQITDPVHTPRGIVRATWSNGQPAAWLANGRLPEQTVTDIAIAGEDILIGTQRGIAVRRIDTFQPIKFIDCGGAIGFRSAAQAGRLLVRLADGTMKQWNGESLSNVDRRGAAVTNVSLNVADQVWHLTGNGLAVVKQSGQTVSWIPYGGTWCLRSDVVTELARAGGFVLKTLDGSWAFDTVTGRARARNIGYQAAESWSISLPAMTVSSNGQTVRFRSADGGPPFVGGRPFHDAGVCFCESGGVLYIYIAGRGVIGRKVGSPSVQAGYWPLASSMPRSAIARLYRDSGAVRLSFGSGSGAPAWDLSPGANAQWRPVSGVVKTIDSYEAGPVIWRPLGSSYMPHAHHGFREYMITEWWRGNRFAWDQASSVAVLSDSMVAASTPGGILAIQIDPSGARHDVALIGAKPGVRLVSARRQGKVFGAITITGDRPELLITPGSSGEPMVTRAWGQSFDRSAHLILQEGADASGIGVGFVQHWTSAPESLVPGRGQVTCSIPWLSGLRLIDNGQFIFDHAERACKLRAGEAHQLELWAVASDATAGIFSINAFVRGPGNDRDRLVLLGVDRGGPRGISLLRSVGNGQVVARDAIGRWWRGMLSPGRSSWQITAPPHTPELRSSDCVELDFSTLTWASRPGFVDEPVKAFTVRHGTSPVFVDRPRGMALGFDCISKLATDQSHHEIAIGTASGVFYGPAAAGALGFLAPYSNGWHFSSSAKSGATSSENLTDVNRLRYDTQGTLWARWGTLNHTATRTAGIWKCTGTDWPNEIRSAHRELAVDAAGVRIDGHLIEVSNDLLGSKSLAGSVGYEFESNSQTLWLCTRDSGLFRVLLDKVRP